MRKSTILFLIVTFVAICVGCGSSSSNPETDADGFPEVDAKKVYRAKCGICHGNDGKKMMSGAPDLSISKMSLEDRIALITNGKGVMPPQKNIMNTKEIIAVAKYIEEFTTN